MLPVQLVRRSLFLLFFLAHMLMHTTESYAMHALIALHYRYICGTTHFFFLDYDCYRQKCQ